MGKLFFVLLVSVGIFSCNAAPTGNFAADSGRFSLNLYNTVAGKSHESVVISPVSVQTALGLLYLGAAGTTARQMSEILNLEADQDVTANNFKSLLDHHAESEAVKIANKVFVDNHFEVKPEFNALAARSFYSEAENLDTSNGARTAQVVNSWVESKTNNKIKNLVQPGDVQGVPSVIVNAVYFKADWTEPFKKEATSKKDYWVSPTQSKKVDMMHQTSYVNYGDFDDFQAVRLPYRGNDFSFVVVLPKDRDGVKPLEARFGEPNANLKVMLDSFKHEPVHLQLPKFKIETDVDLTSTLKSMNLTAMFSPSADFSKLSSQPVRVGKVIHKAVIEVDEKGTEAAAATAITIERSGHHFRFPPKDFVADHPFLFFLVDSNGHIFFMGRHVE